MMENERNSMQYCRDDNDVTERGFDWNQFLDEYKIESQEKGASDSTVYWRILMDLRKACSALTNMSSDAFEVQMEKMKAEREKRSKLALNAILMRLRRT